jgi:hypothetical protein
VTGRCELRQRLTLGLLLFTIFMTMAFYGILEVGHRLEE